MGRGNYKVAVAIVVCSSKVVAVVEYNEEWPEYNNNNKRERERMYIRIAETYTYTRTSTIYNMKQQQKIIIYL